MPITKGDWKTDGKLYIDGNGDKVIDIIAETENGDNQEFIAETCNVANAHLIAAAPDLYEALKESTMWVAKMSADGSPIAGRVLTRMNKALAKAES